MIYKFREYQKRDILSGHLKMGGINPAGEKIEVNSSYLTRNGKPWIPIMGEFHFSRCDRKKWKEELCKMKAGGITLVSTYLFWIYHEETEGEFCFEGDRDIRAFVMTCKEIGLEVALRIGPWAHGECRNGGFPDWLLEQKYPLRTNDAQYLEQVRKWYQRIAAEVRGLFYKYGGNIVAIQLENELVDNADHLGTLKKIAVECGMEAPIYTVTGWNSASGARIPVDEVLPTFGGYCEAPWLGHTKRLPASSHYFFVQMRNDSAIGADLLIKENEDGWQLPYERYPFATCELGGGIQVTHHRRPIVRPMDIYAIALVMLGVGNNWPGYYMYHGGTNKIGKKTTFQESKATGYPSDYPVLSYDFQAPISEFGEIREQYRLLNLLHLFLQDFQEEFAPLQAVEALGEITCDDITSLRYGMRTDGQSGYVFVNHYQRLTHLEDVKGAVIDTGEVVFPPIDIVGEISFFMPFMMKLGENGSETILEYATAQPVCRMGNTYFFVKIPGIPAVYHFRDDREICMDTGKESVPIEKGLQIVTLEWEDAKYLRRLEENDGNGLYIGDGCDLYKHNNILCCAELGTHNCFKWDGKKFVPFIIGKKEKEAKISLESIDKIPFEIMCKEELQLESDRSISFKKMIVSGAQGFVSITEEYDVAQIYVDGQLTADNFYYGRPWKLPASLLAGRECYLVMSERKDDFYREFE